MLECLTLDWGFAGSSITGGTALCPWSRHFILSLVLVQPGRPVPTWLNFFWLGRKESNKKNKKKLNKWYHYDKFLPGGNVPSSFPLNGKQYNWSIWYILGKKKKRRIYRLKILCVKWELQNSICYLCLATFHVAHYSHCFIELSQPKPVYWLSFYFQVSRAHSFYLDLHM